MALDRTGLKIMQIKRLQIFTVDSWIDTAMGSGEGVKWSSIYWQKQKQAFFNHFEEGVPSEDLRRYVSRGRSEISTWDSRGQLADEQQPRAGGLFLPRVTPFRWHPSIKYSGIQGTSTVDPIGWLDPNNPWTEWQKAGRTGRETCVDVKL